MTSEILLHVDEEMDDAQRLALLSALGNPPNGPHADHHSRRPHLMFVAYDHAAVCPHDLVALAAEQGYHATVVDL